MTLIVIGAGLLRAWQVGGFVHEADEGRAAHLFQLFMPLEVPIVAIFAVTQLPRDARWAMRVLALQVGAAVALFAVVFFLA